VTRLMEYLPRGNTLEAEAWRRRHLFLQWVLLLHIPVLFPFGLVTHHSVGLTALVLAPLPLCLLAGRYITHRRTASLFITAGLVWCSAVMVGFSRGSIEAHFHFFVMIGFIALYQDWTPFLWNIVFVVISHGLGSAFQKNLIFNHSTGRWGPWLWSGIHGLAVLVACAGVVIFWKTTEEEQQKTLDLTKQLADAEIARREFASDMLVNLARRNQSLLHRQLDIINQLEEHEHDADALGELFRLDHLATRIRRNAESLLVLSGEEPPRVWSEPVPLLDVVRAAVAETEDLDRVAHFIDEHLAVKGHTVTDLTHLLAELVENAVRFSPPEASVIVKTRPHPAAADAYLLTVEDWGIGMRPEDLAAANDLLGNPREVDLSVSQRLGLHVVARLAQRHGIRVSLVPTPGCGLTAVVVLPPDLFASVPVVPQGNGAAAAAAAAAPPAVSAVQAPQSRPRPAPVPPSGVPGRAGSPASGNGAGAAPQPAWSGWWRPFTEEDAQEAPPPAAPPLAVAETPPPPADDPPAPGGEPQLTRRVPQAHLAPELRLAPPQPPHPAPAASSGDALPRAQEALARYQASRRAARATMEDTQAEQAASTGTGSGDPGQPGGRPPVDQEWPRVNGGGPW
jgi:signal transduction histidine kinase